jgi:tetratricopeptide (TPR) repeat protein
MAKRRHTDPAKLPSSLKGDLDWIVMKCLEKDRKRRYETANGLAMDLQRHLANEVVTARSPTTAYLLGKLIRRNKLPFAAATAAILALILGAVLSTVQAFRAKRAEAAASLAKDQMEAIHSFLVNDLLLQATPDENAREKKVTIEDALRRASRNLDQNTDMARNPVVEATLRYDFGNTYFQLGSPSDGEPHLRRALALRRSTLGPDHLDTLVAEVRLSELLVMGLQEFAEAKPLVLHAWLKLRELLGDKDRLTLDAMNAYAAILTHEGKLGEDERLSREYLRLCESAFGPDGHDAIVAIVNLAISAQTRGDYAEAERLAREAQLRFDRRGQSGNVDAFWNILNLAAYRWWQGDPLEAENLLTEARPRAVKVQGEDNTVTLHIGHLLARVLAERGKLAEAMKLAREVLDKRKRVVPGSEAVGRTELALARMLIAQGEDHYSEAETLLQDALSIFREKAAMKPQLAAQAENALGGIRLRQKSSLDEAERLLLANPDLLLTPSAQMSRKEQETAVGYIVELYAALARPAEAQRWQDKLISMKASGSHTPLKDGTPSK